MTSFCQKILSLFFVIGLVEPCLGASLYDRPQFLYVENEETNEPSLYDPFIDYKEFERNDRERKDLRFFKEGKFIILGGGVGGRFFTNTFRHHITPFLNYSVYLGLFLNLDLMVQVNGLFSIHQAYLGEDSFVQFHGGGVDLRYYFDKGRLNKPLAFLNPYLLIGFSAVRSTIVPIETGNLGRYQENGYGFRVGGGIEIELGRRFFTGLHADFNFIDFGWEYQPWETLDGALVKGDFINLLWVLGVNF